MRRLELGAVVLAVVAIVGVPTVAIAYERQRHAPDEIVVVARMVEHGGWSPSTISVKAGQLVRLRMTSDDVVHSLYIPALELDSGPIYPGRWVLMEFAAPENGELRIKCDIACGLLHAKMSAKLVIGDGTAVVAASPAPAPAATSPSGEAAPAAASLATPAPAVDALLALGKTVYETAGGDGCQDCHGPNAKGRQTKTGTNAPNIRGTTEQKLRDALAGGAPLMSFLELTDQEIEAVLRYLDYLNEQP